MGWEKGDVVNGAGDIEVWRERDLTIASKRKGTEYEGGEGLTTCKRKVEREKERERSVGTK